MSDISMCGNEKCSIKRKCYRYVAEPNGWQSYAKFEGGKKCKGFIKGTTSKTYGIQPQDTEVQKE